MKKRTYYVRKGMLEERDLTNAELAAVKAEQAKAALMERTRPLTAEEVTAMLIRQQINTITVDDQTALRMVAYYPEWADLIGQTVDKADFRFTYGGKLYKTIPANHTFQADWVPGVGTEALYTRIDETHTGDQYDPIPYDGNMALTAGLYYTQGGEVYLCNRDTGIAVYNALSELVGLYVEEMQG